MDNREAIEWLKGCVVAYEVDSKGKPNGNVTCELIQEVIDMAISALEKQEQSNAQNVNSMHRVCPNALESLNILEQAKDDKGCVPMSLVRQAFRNVMEQDRWIPVTERLPEKEGCYLVTVQNDHKRKYSKTAWYSGDGWFARQDIIAWRPTPKAYTEEEDE